MEEPVAEENRERRRTTFKQNNKGKMGILKAIGCS